MVALFVSLASHGLVFSAVAYVHYGKGVPGLSLNFVNVSLEMDGRIMGGQEPARAPAGNKTQGPRAGDRLRGENIRPSARPEPSVQAAKVNDGGAVESEHAGTEKSPGNSSSENLAAGNGSGISGPGDDSESSGSSGKASEGVRKASPVYSRNPPPVYPRSARARRLEGTVELNVLVDTEGRVRDLNLRKTSGYTVLDRAAMDSVKQWIFEPGKTGCCPMEMWVVVPMVFKLTEA